MPPFRRRPPTKTPKKRFLVVCEGEKSEPSYIEGVKRILRTALIEIEIIAPAGATKEAVEHATKEMKAADRQARKSGDPFDKYDEVWCVLDVDQHPKLTEALKQASDNKIEVALSNPCFELWVVLHHRDERKHIERGALQRECKVVYKRDDKHVPFESLWPLFEVAQKNAVGLRKWQLENDRKQVNPWTNFDELIDTLMGKKKENK